MGFGSFIKKATHQISHGVSHAAHQVEHGAKKAAKFETGVLKKTSNPTDIFAKKITQKIGGKKLEAYRQAGGQIGGAILIGSVAGGGGKLGLKAASKADAWTNKKKAHKLPHHSSHDAVLVTDNQNNKGSVLGVNWSKYTPKGGGFAGANNGPLPGGEKVGVPQLANHPRRDVLSSAAGIFESATGAVADFWEGHDGIKDSDFMADVMGPNPDGSTLDTSTSLMQNKWLWIIAGAALLWYFAKKK